MNISLTPELKKFIADRVQSGLYHSSSEVVREALRLLQEQQMFKEIKLAELKQEIQKGKDSGPSKELDIEDVIRRGKKRLANQSSS
ncbi:MAG: type II toxin-antitoxin system ParD family antitoxin [Acaryochloridaceae cyanobacterium RU_4_10]|nr:type II toxin-antitoxin system ParD family antitoxin [Acaryochloridaceae cyanobacterium RU_4_10]